MQTTDCTKFQEDLKAYADGELPLARRLQVGAHLEQCAACREEVTQMERIARDVRGLENIGEATLSPELRARVLARVNEVRPIATPSIPFWKRQPLLVFGSAGAALTAATVLILMYAPAQEMAMSEYARSSQSQPAAAPAAGAAPSAATMEKQENAAPAESDSKGDERKAAADSPTYSTAARARQSPAVRAMRPESAPPQLRSKSGPPPAPMFGASGAGRAAEGGSVGGKAISPGAGAARSIPVRQNVEARKPRAEVANLAKKDAETERADSHRGADAAAMAPLSSEAAPPPPAPAAPTRRAVSTITSRVQAADTTDEIRLVIEVEDIKSAEQEIDRLAKEAGGSVTTDATAAEAERKPLTARIPVKDVESFRKSVSQLGKPLPSDPDAAKNKSVAGGFEFRGGAAAKPATDNRSIRVILVRKPAP